MSMQWVRDSYGVPAKRGGRVRVTFGLGPEFMKNTDLYNMTGTITKATQYVFVRLDGEKWSHRFHPLDLEYLEEVR